jgi:hypothetical protein
MLVIALRLTSVSPMTQINLSSDSNFEPKPELSTERSVIQKVMRQFNALIFPLHLCCRIL